jgi:hypothetical protein
MITHVAILDINKKIWSLPRPNRHHNVIHMINEQSGRDIARGLLKDHVQGFMNDSGQFLTRKEAFYEALRCDQLLPPYNPINPSERHGEINKNPRELFSEDLW